MVFSHHFYTFNHHRFKSWFYSEKPPFLMVEAPFLRVKPWLLMVEPCWPCDFDDQTLHPPERCRSHRSSVPTKWPRPPPWSSRTPRHRDFTGRLDCDIHETLTHYDTIRANMGSTLLIYVFIYPPVIAIKKHRENDNDHWWKWRATSNFQTKPYSATINQQGSTTAQLNSTPYTDLSFEYGLCCCHAGVPSCYPSCYVPYAIRIEVLNSADVPSMYCKKKWSSKIHSTYIHLSPLITTMSNSLAIRLSPCFFYREKSSKSPWISRLWDFGALAVHKQMAMGQLQELDG